MNSAELSQEIRRRAQRMREAESEESSPLTRGELADNSELLLCLARFVEGKAPERVFGAPGDWGYSHPIGRALAAKENS